MTMAETAILSSNIPKGISVLLVPIPECKDLKGLAEDASTENYRDRSDRVG